MIGSGENRSGENVAFAAGNRRLFDKNSVHIDNQASVAVFCNENLLTNIRSSDHSMRINGVGGSIVCNEIGDYEWYGEVYFCKAAPTNILCFYDVQERFNTTFDSDKNCFLVEVSDNRTVVFKCGNTDIDQKLYSLSHDAEAQNTVCAITTVDGNRLNFTKRQIADADKAQYCC
jgi:hypothetical protein